MSPRPTVAVTHNVERNLEEIQEFLVEHGASAAFAALVDQLFESVVPNLERFPELGTDFLARRAGSVQGAARIERRQARLGPGTTLHEYISGDFLILYAVRDHRRWLLAIRHHKQLSYDLRTHWVR